MSGTRRNPGPLGPFVDGYRSRLIELGYSPGGVTRSLTALGHLGRWMDSESVTHQQLSAEVISTFLSAYRRDHGHLPAASVMSLLEYMREAGVVPLEPERDLGPLDQLVDGFRAWLTIDRSLAPDTVRGYTQLASRFLTSRATETDPLGLNALSGADVTRFLLAESARLKPGSVRCHANQLRQLLRYLGIRGHADPGLAAAVPAIGRWRDATLPQFPQRPAIELMLKSCDRKRRVGARDYAILTLLARLGLRTIEVARLRLGDLYWRAGEIEIDGKGHERARLPLSVDVGEALAAYLRLRGPHPSLHVFLCEHAPTRPLQAAGVRSVVRDACRRAGIEHVPAHRLRHALASELLAQGASLIDVGQVLRHKHLESTAIYAKVDLARLRQAAGPWPGATR